MNKENLVSWLEKYISNMEIQESRQLVARDFDAAARMDAMKRVIINIKNKIESGKFDEEVTPCENVTPATTE